MSKQKQSFASSYIYSILYRLSICVLPLVVTPYIARVLTPEDNGIYVFTSTVACVFIMLCKLGLDSYGNRSIAFVRDDPEKRARTFWEIYSMQLLTSALSLSVYLALLLLVRENRGVYVLQLFYVLSGVFDVSWYFYGLESFRLTTVRSILARLLVVLGVFVLVKNETHLPIYTGVLAVCFLLEQLSLMLFIFRDVGFVRVRMQDIKKHISPNLKLFIPILAINVYHWADKIMLGTICAQDDVAFYNYAESIINLPKGLILALGTVMLPRISYLITHDREKDGIRLLGDSVELTSFVSCALCFGIMGVASSFIPLFLGEQYLPTVLLTVELSVVMLPMSISDIIQNQYLIPYKKDKLNIIAISLGALLNILLNLLFIPLLGASGAVIATLGAELFVCTVLLVALRRVYTVKQLAVSLLPYILIGLVEAYTASLFATAAAAHPAMIVLQVLCGGGVYLALSLLYFTVRKKLSKAYSDPVTRLLREMRSAKEQ